jgi:fluoride exporter
VTDPQTQDRAASRREPGARARHHVRLQVAIVAGGVLGALGRAALERAAPWEGHGWPWPTFTVNVAGTVLLGYLVTRLQERLPPSTYRRPLLGTGLCGALTTFSTMQIELITLARNDEAALALAYLCATIVAGLAGMYAASTLTRRVVQ